MAFADMQLREVRRVLTEARDEPDAAQKLDKVLDVLDAMVAYFDRLKEDERNAMMMARANLGSSIF